MLFVCRFKRNTYFYIFYRNQLIIVYYIEKYNRPSQLGSTLLLIILHFRLIDLKIKNLSKSLVIAHDKKM